MRIIGGEFKGRRLFAVPGVKTRPTADRLKESLFNILSDTVHGAIVLDLFAGTGALGLEALSRGARRAVFIDKSRQSLSVIHRNIQCCNLASRAHVIRWDAGKNLNCLTKIEAEFNLVLMDPPYGRQIVANALRHLHQSSCLSRSALVVVEHQGQENFDLQPQMYTLTDQRKYGKTLVSFLRYMV